jgi:hypothetical protein
VELVELKQIHDKTEPIAEFLRAHIQGPIRVKGSRIEIEGAKHDEVKLLLHKFLHQRHLEGYKVHSQPGMIEIVHAKKGEESEESKGRPPTAPETMPYFFPGR